MVRTVVMNIQRERDPMNGMIEGYVSCGRRGALALVLMGVAESFIPGYADHSMIKRNVTGATVPKYIQEYRKEKGARFRVNTLITLDIAMMDIAQLLKDIEEHKVDSLKILGTTMIDIRHPITEIEEYKENLFYITRELIPSRGNPTYNKERTPTWKTGHT